MRIRNLRASAVAAAAFIMVASVMTACGELTGPTSPSTPSNVVATLASATSVTVTWSPSPLNDGVISYSIYRNGVKVGESETTTFTDTGLAQQTTYVYSVAANCKAGVVSDRSEETAASTIRTVDLTPPTVVSNQPPANFNGVSPAATATVTFSEPMDPATIAAAFTLRVTGGASIPGAVTYNTTTRVAEFKPTAPMPNPANITASVSTGAKDLAGNAMAAAFSWTFTTRDDSPPTVTAVSPANGAAGVSPATQVTVTFSEAMDATTITAANVVLKLTSSGATVAASLTYNPTTRVATLVPSGALAQLTGYTVTVNGVKDAAGNLIAAPFNSTFTTGDTTAPSVTAVVPAQGASGIALNSTVKVTFSEPMDATTITTATVTLKNTATSAPVAGAVVYDPATRVATFTPTSALTGNTGYTVTVTTGAQDASGNGLASPFISTFTTLNPDNTPPTVSAVSPIAGASGVAVTDSVLITFSEPMDAATIIGANVTLRNTATTALIPATVTYDPATRIAKLKPNAPLATGTSYTVGVSTAVKDAAGNPMAAPFVSTFTTFIPDSTPPIVTGVVPVSGAAGIPTNTSVTVTFSEAMDAATIIPANITLRNAGTSAPVAGTVVYTVATNSATFTPTGPLANGTQYAFMVSTGVTDLAGNHLAANFNSTFTTALVTDVTPPTVVSRTPPNGATGVAINTNVTVTFSEPMQSATINTSTVTLTPTAGGSAVTATVVYDPGTNTATLDPAVDLANNTSYTINVTTGVKDAAGNAMAANSPSTFTTIADTTAPVVTGTSPVAGAANVAVTSSITATFSENMDAATLNSPATTFTVRDNVTATNIAGTVSYNAATRVATFTPAANLVANRNYTATITTGAKDAVGNPLVANTVFSFTTAP